jgi:hypothetical protein
MDTRHCYTKPYLIQKVAKLKHTRAKLKTSALSLDYIRFGYFNVMLLLILFIDAYLNLYTCFGEITKEIIYKINKR